MQWGLPRHERVTHFPVQPPIMVKFIIERAEYEKGCFYL